MLFIAISEVIIMKHLAEKQILEEVVRKAERDKEVLAIMLFGSRAARKNTKNSDIDICLFLSRRKRAFHKVSEFSEISSRLDASEFYSLPLYIRRRILKEGKLLFCRDMKLLHYIAIDTVNQYRHYGRHYYYYTRKVLHG